MGGAESQGGVTELRHLHDPRTAEDAMRSILLSVRLAPFFRVNAGHLLYGVLADFQC